MATPQTLAAWLAFVERQHPSAIALGLERVGRILGRLDATLACPVLTVGGTNGKGSTCALLESILRAAGYRTGLYTSPHLLRYNERVRINGKPADDASLCEAFAAVEAVRAGEPLTYFEFGTLAALWLYARTRLDAVVLEVGLGGRLDAVNAVEPDCSILTSVGIDHVDYLGGTRESIGREKAGIFRARKPAVIAEPDPPSSVTEHALAVGAQALRFGRDFGYSQETNQAWTYWGPGGRRAGLAHPALRGEVQLRNAAAALCALETQRARLPISMQDVRRGLAEVALPARFQVLPGRPRVILDVAHNPEAAKTLAANLSASGYAPRTIAVFGMLRDKDIESVVREVASRFARWHVATLPGGRGAQAEDLRRIVTRVDPSASVAVHASPAQAFAAARDEAQADDKIVAFGSFLTVGEVMASLEAERGGTLRHG